MNVEPTTINQAVYFPSSLSAINDITRLESYSQLVVLCDENTRALCLPRLMNDLPIVEKAYILEIPSGEAYKNLDTCQKLWEALLQLQIDRNALFINLGGGVITDMGGFVATTYKRGIDFINLPTTLLAQVDASIGGKLGVDLGGLKNAVGLFSEPKQTFIYATFLNTLDELQLMSGFAEMLKHGLISSSNDWQTISAIIPLQQNDWTDLIARSVKIKQQIVAQDPLEKGPRKMLNFGHTIGHAIEGASLSTNSPLLHGHAIVLGMIAELWLSALKTGFPKQDVQKISSVLLKLYHPYFNIERNIPHWLKLMANDKKNNGGNIQFTLLKNIGEPVMDIVVSENEVLQALKYLEEIL